MSVWVLLADNLEPVTWYASLFVALAGFIALCLVGFCWRPISRWYREVWAKCAVAAFRFVAAGAAVASRAAPVAPGQPLWGQPWVATILIAGAGYLFWEVAGAVGDNRVKRDKERTADDHRREVEALTQDRDDAVQQADRLNWLVAHVRESAGEKLQRIRRVKRSGGGSRASIPLAREGLDPDGQIRILLETLASLFRLDVVSSPGGYGQNFRVGPYAEKNGSLVPIDAFDLSTRGHGPFTSYRTHPDRYRLDNTANPSHAVRCVVEGRVLIVPDCATDPGFEFFGGNQRTYLRSMVAYPLEDFCRDGLTPVRAALLIDTNVTGYFREEDRQIIEARLKEVAARIDLEYAIKGLIG